MNIQRLIETHNTHEEPHDWSEQAKEALWQLQNALEQETTMLRQQQAEIEALNRELLRYKSNGEMGYANELYKLGI